MLNALAQFFTPEAGQARRQWLNDQEQRVGNALAYYLGPAADPLQSAAMLAGYMTPGADMMDASNAGRELFNAETPMDAATAAATAIAAGGMMLLPGNVGALREGFDQSVNALAAYDPTTVNAFRAYHGSPHTFDRFSLDHIGTGEGAQAYGHGLYFAENEGVARAYRDALSGNNFDTGYANIDAMLNGGAYQGDWARFKADYANRMPEIIADIEQRGAAVPIGSSGSMYEVQINADPADFLDWDAPLSAQPQGVREWFDSRGIGPGFAGEQSGGSLYLAERSALGGAPEVSTEMLSGGVPGIRYLDHGSRFSDGATNTRNFVVFDDSIINILRRYGIGAAVAGGGWALSPEDAQAATDMGVLDPQQRDRQQITDWLNTL